MSDKVQLAVTRHVLLHFDLKKSGDRSATYKAIEGIGAPGQVRRLTESVFVAHIPDGVEATRFAEAVWKALEAATKGQLAEGDRFFLHYAGTTPGYIDVMFQVVGKTGRLDSDPQKSILESLFLG
jgi:hypothetical protein